MRKIYTLLALLVISMSMGAAPRTAEQALAAAKQVLARRAARHAPGHVTHATPEPRLLTKEKAYYVFAADKGEGFVLISADDRLPAVIGYADNGDYVADALPAPLSDFLAQYRDFLSTATDGQIRESAAFKAQAKHTAVEPLIKTKWGQDAPYNNMCPIYSGAERCATGCTATAMAQVLKCHNSPAQLKATIPAYDTRSYKLHQSAIEAGEQYDWTNMLDTYNSSSTEQQKDAVAKLMYHLGCALEMNYGPSSGAYTNPEVLTKYFGMDKETTRTLYRRDYALGEWDGMLYAELAAQRPVVYSGSTGYSAHAFNIDGYLDGLYHVNWGWEGMCDGYFDITILNSDRSDVLGTGDYYSASYSMNNSMIVGIQPDNGIVDDVPSSALQCASSDEYISELTFSGGTVTASVKDIIIININDTALTRYVALAYKDGSGAWVTVSKPEKIDFREYEAKTYHADTLSFAAAEGETYVIQPVESKDSVTWLSVRYPKKTAIAVTGGKAELTAVAAKLTATVALHSGETGLARTGNAIDITLTNSGNEEYYDKIEVFISNTDTIPDRESYAQGVTVPVGETVTISFDFETTDPGVYNFWVRDATGNGEIGKDSITFVIDDAHALALTSIKIAQATGRKGYHPAMNWFDLLEMEEVAGTSADFVFSIRNDGSDCEGDFRISIYGGPEGTWQRYDTRHLVLPAKATTDVTISVEGKAGDVVGAEIDNYYNDRKIAELTTPIRHPIINTTQWLGCYLKDFCYLYDPTPTGITEPSVPAYSPAAPCYNQNGQRVGASARGIIIQNGRKTLRR